MILFIHANIYCQHLSLSQPVRFLALGDSYTAGTGIETGQGWPNQLFDRLAQAGYEREKIQVIARAGWRTDDLAQAIAIEKPSSDFNLVSLLIGVNNQYQGVSIDLYEPAFEELLKSAISLAGGNKKSVFVLSIPDYGYTPFGQGFSEASREIDLYNAINRKIAAEYEITYFDITTISRLGRDNPELLASDGLHPSALMYELWVNIIMDHIRNNNPQETIIKEDVFTGGIRIFPNPASAGVTIHISYPDNSVVNTISIYSITGELKFSKTEIINESPDNISLILPALNEGIYLLELVTDSGRIVKRMIITEGNL